ncbi:DUF4238 domain-containing protein [Bradyrhizobium sp. AZCC 2289]|uniref:DUF4238 domain-containing protein n=1 Tax=Bradyrhizobium sp. AZCC 2289 TaxID=3117026 RepID=UPI002FF10632
MKDDLIFSELVRRCPALDRVTAYRLASVWSALQGRIVARMFDICEAEMGASLHIDQRAEAAFELSRLLLFLSGRILDEKAKQKALSEHDPDDEAALLETKEEQAKIDATARNMADGVWKPLLAKWRKRRPLVEMPGQAAKRSKLVKPAKSVFRKHMHYVPQSTTKQWASAKSGKFTVYKIGADGEVKAEATTAKLWGAAPSLYTQGLEHLLGLIEGDARRPYQKLVDIVPLDAMETRRWIAFLIAQLIRTPRFMRSILRYQKAWIESTGFNYPTTPAHLGQVYETLFTNNDLYAAYYKQITRRAWAVASAADGLTFLKGENPVVISGRPTGDSWRLLYPLTPTRCFIAGPELEGEPRMIIPRQHVLTDADTIAVNAATCNYAETSVIGISIADRIDPRPTIKTHLSRRNAPSTVELPLWGLNSEPVSSLVSGVPRR